MKMTKRKKCLRCKNPFNANIMIANDDVCRTCELMNCISFWYPRLYRLNFPMPKTIILHTNLPLENLFGGERPEETSPLYKNIMSFVIDIRLATTQVGFPAFLRTGHTSNKHDWKNSCFLDKETLKDEKKVLGHIANLVDQSGIMTIDRMTPIDFWAVREFIETETYFTYFRGEMPITKERRYFVKNGKIECHHNYWDRKAFKNDIDEKKFKELSTLSEEDEKLLNGMAVYVANVFQGYWSCDFLKGKNGKWYLTDMAIGERSYHEVHKTTK